MKILFILEYFHPNIGGVETLFKALTDRLVNDGHKIIVLTTKVSKDSPFKEGSEKWIIYRFPFINRFIFTFLGFFPALYLSFKCDLIHTSSYNAGVPAFFAGLFSRKKVVITFHEVWGRLWFSLPYLSLPLRYLYFYYELLLIKMPFDRYIAISKFTKRALINSKVPEDKIQLIYNGINYSDFLPKSESVVENETYTFCFFGRLGVSKGLDLLLDAIEDLSKRNVKFKLNLIIPKTPKRFYNLIQKLISRKCIEDHIDQFDNLSFDDLKSKIKSSDAVIIPSHSEGFGFSAVESVALGMPIITSGKGSLSEVVSGKFIMMKDHSASGLAKAMELAIDDKWESSNLMKFELSNSVNDLVELYKTLE